jgi:hypothetical protein
MQMLQKSSLKNKGAPRRKRAICQPSVETRAAAECSFDGIAQRAKAETTVMLRLLSFPIHEPKN